MGLPSNGVVVDAQSYVLREIAERYSERVELVYPAQLCQRIFHDYARNCIVDDFMASDCDVLWFLDSDVSPQKHVLDLITEHFDKWEAAGAAYPVFMTPPGEDFQQVVFTAYKGSNGKGISPAAIPHEGTEFLDGLATGCLFLKRSVFEKLQKPYFEFKYDPVTRNPIEGEDLGFCLKLNALGIKFFTDYSMVCKHQKTVCLLNVNNYAQDYAQKAVLAYDRDIRAKVMALAKQNAELMAQLRKMTSAPQSTSQLIIPKGTGILSSR